MVKIGQNLLNDIVEVNSDLISNKHLLITGKSGTGKSTFIQKYIESNKKESGIVFIPDFTGDWKNRIQEERKVVDCRKEGLPLPVFKRQKVADDLETDYEMAKRITDVFAEVYRLGSTQSVLLQKVIQSEIEETDEISWKRILKSLMEIGAESLCLKIEEMVESQVFAHMNHEIKFSRINIFDLSGLSLNNQNICMETFLWWSFDYVVRRTEKIPVLIVLDEFQRMKLREKSPLLRLLTEGRKYGIELILATQTASLFDKKEMAILEQVGTRIYFQPSESEINMIKRQFPVNIQNKVKERLSQLPVGHALAVGKFKVNGQTRMSNNPIEIVI